MGKRRIQDPGRVANEIIPRVRHESMYTSVHSWKYILQWLLSRDCILPPLPDLLMDWIEAALKDHLRKC